MEGRHALFRLSMSSARDWHDEIHTELLKDLGELRRQKVDRMSLASEAAIDIDIAHCVFATAAFDDAPHLTTMSC